MTAKTPSVAVVIPTFNRSRLLVRALESVQQQTRAVDEIIVVDDGSFDDTETTVKRMAAVDERIRYVRQDNKGANAARNEGISQSTSSWIAFLDSDDRWLPHKIERQLAAAANTDAVCVFTNWTGVDGDRRLYDTKAPDRISLSDICALNWLGTTSSLMANRRALTGVGGFDTSLPSCQDWDLYIRLRMMGDFVVVPESLLLYDDGPHDRISRNNAKAVAGHVMVHKRALAALNRGPLPRKHVAQHHLNLATIYGQKRRRILWHKAAAALLHPERALREFIWRLR